MALNNTPLTGQTLGQTKVPINQNFSVINAGFSVDHVTFNASNQGFHNKVTLVQQSSEPTFSSPNTGLWSQLNPITNQPDTCVAAVTAAGNESFPLTASILSTTTPAANSAGWTYLPSGILLKWGNGTANGQTTINFPIKRSR